MTRGAYTPDGMTLAQNALAYEFRDAIALGDEDEFLLTDTNPEWSWEDRAVVAEFFERPALAAQLRARKEPT